jgi:uncharacterized surface protein with fasciclin (FAS1) repeats
MERISTMFNRNVLKPFLGFFMLLALIVLANPLAEAQTPSKDIVETAVNAGSFTTLVAALQAAGLVDALKADGPFTVFAPNDEAFAKLPKGTVESLLKDIPKLKSILLYHVVSGNILSADLSHNMKAKTLQGEKVKIRTKGGVRVNEAKVITPDIKTSNGVIHVIDTVLLPKK